MSEWSHRPVRELCSHIVDCVNKTAPTVDMTTPFKMLRTTNVRNGWVDTSSVRHVDKPTFERWTRRMRPRRGDIVLTREAPLGEVGMIRTDDLVFLGQRLVMYRVDRDQCDPRFLMYAMLGPTVQAELRSLGSGATVEHLRVPDCEKLSIPSPSLALQRRIGSILGGLDDLIENNRRRIELLEKLAQAIYREWFVHFRYPGYEDEPLVDSVLGPIPVGWDAVAASELLAINPRLRLVKTDEHPFLTMSDLSERSMLCLFSERKTGSSGSKFQNGDTLFARITPCLENGKTGLVQCLAPEEIGRGSTEFIVLRGKRVGPAFTYFLARDDEFRSNAINSMSGASGRQRVRNECFDSFLVAAPPESLAEEFEALAEPMLGMAFVLGQENQELLALRDHLLPKLVTGQIDVSGLDVDAVRESAG